MGSDTERVAQALLRRLRALAPSEIEQFEELWFQAQDKLYNWSIRDAATLLLGPLSEDDFPACRTGSCRTGGQPCSVSRTVELARDRRNARIDWFCGLPLEAHIAATGAPLAIDGPSLGEARGDHHRVRVAAHPTGTREIDGHRRPQRGQSRRVGMVERAVRRRRQHAANTAGPDRTRERTEIGNPRPQLDHRPGRRRGPRLLARVGRFVRYVRDPGARAGRRHQPPFRHQLRVRLHHRAPGPAQVGGSGSRASATRPATGRSECSPVTRSPAFGPENPHPDRTPDTGRVTPPPANDLNRLATVRVRRRLVDRCTCGSTRLGGLPSFDLGAESGSVGRR
ncbi:DUF4240 domain-containing protein [Micromonospora sp. NPDC005087]|uniref:DUF4240 domain-containing protein n=1 Tax=Micromonospora sp. NPDC005087 TaxID=3364225 RepID=UPI003685A8C7